MPKCRFPYSILYYTMLNDERRVTATGSPHIDRFVSHQCKTTNCVYQLWFTTKDDFCRFLSIFVDLWFFPVYHSQSVTMNLHARIVDGILLGGFWQRLKSDFFLRRAHPPKRQRMAPLMFEWGCDSTHSWANTHTIHQILLIAHDFPHICKRFIPYTANLDLSFSSINDVDCKF